MRKGNLSDDLNNIYSVLSILGLADTLEEVPVEGKSDRAVWIYKNGFYSPDINIAFVNGVFVCQVDELTAEHPDAWGALETILRRCSGAKH
ncbi:MAG: hypothetical protein H7Z12_15455 [Rhodospirillaceae bacterium]|nr:hypothetical protein [Rhodospirillales bacterium]